MPEWFTAAVRESPKAGVVAFFGIPVVTLGLVVAGLVPWGLLVIAAFACCGTMVSVRRNRLHQG